MFDVPDSAETHFAETASRPPASVQPLVGPVASQPLASPPVDSRPPHSRSPHSRPPHSRPPESRSPHFRPPESRSPHSAKKCPDALAAEITTLAGHLNAAQYRFLKLLDEFDREQGWAGPRGPFAGPLAELEVRARRSGRPREGPRGSCTARVALDRRCVRARRGQLLKGASHDPCSHTEEREAVAQHRSPRHRRAHGTAGAGVSAVPQAGGNLSCRSGDAAGRALLLFRRR